MQLNKMFKEFNELYGIDVKPVTQAGLRKALHLIQDEVDEFADELFDTDLTPDLKATGAVIPAWQPKLDEDLDKPNIAKEMTDILYITMQKMIENGFDVEACLSEVHESNMSKRVYIDDLEMELKEARTRYPDVYEVQLSQNWFVLIDASSNKVVKPMCYSPADLEAVLNG